MIRALAHTFESEPGVTARKIGAFLIAVEYQAVVITSAMFLTSMAPNLLTAELAQKKTRISPLPGRYGPRRPSFPVSSP